MKAPHNESHVKCARLGGLGACLPGKNSDLLRSFLVQSWGDIVRVGEPAAIPTCSHCAGSL